MKIAAGPDYPGVYKLRQELGLPLNWVDMTEEQRKIAKEAERQLRQDDLNNPNTEIGKTKVLVDQFLANFTNLRVEYHNIPSDNMFEFVRLVLMSKEELGERNFLELSYYTYRLRDLKKNNGSLWHDKDNFDHVWEEYCVRQDFYTLADLARKHIEGQYIGPVANDARSAMERIIQERKLNPSLSTNEIIKKVQESYPNSTFTEHVMFKSGEDLDARADAEREDWANSQESS